MRGMHEVAMFKYGAAVNGATFRLPNINTLVSIGTVCEGQSTGLMDGR